MKKSLVAIFLVFVIIFSIVPMTATAELDVCFIAINEKLFSHEEALAYTEDGIVYVPYDIFVNFRIYYTYYSKDMIVTMYSSTTQVYFDIATSTSTGSDGQVYNFKIITKGGKVYLPAQYMCEQFGLTYSYIPSSGSGAICRMTDDTVILDDEKFIPAATTQLQARYDAYVASLNSPVVTPSDNPDEEVTGCNVYLSFDRMPTSTLLDTLKYYDIRATFFLTAYEIETNADTVRRIVGEGHKIGILCSDIPNVEYVRASDLLFEIAAYSTIMIASSLEEHTGICEQYADENGLVLCSYDIDGVKSGSGITYVSEITSYLQYYTETVSIRISLSTSSLNAMSSLLKYLDENEYVISPVNEVNRD